MCSECKKCDGDRCNYFDNDSDRESTIACILFEPKNPTVFDRITASPEVLAEKLVYNKMYMIQDGILQYWVSSYFSTIMPGKSWEYETEAIAATVAKLKEVAE
jgi:hypothetical protein